jgi:phenylpropionate dioxygenase-like ring-hydroxylating dioxygenase large terminal subunit
MVNSKGTGLDELIANHHAGFTLPRPFYCDREIFDAEISRVFLRNWLLAGHISQLPAVGSYLLYDFAGESIILVRGKEGGIHALANVCRHRGSQICSEPLGRMDNFICPYHSWVYDLNGKLKSARAMPPGFDPAQYSLKSFQVRILDGLIFINPDSESPDFDRIIKDIFPLIRMHHLDQTMVCHTKVWTVSANWKLMIENFDECYHCKSIHPQYTAVMAHALPESQGLPEGLHLLESYIGRWEEQTARRNHPVGRLDLAADYAHWGGRYPLTQGLQSQTMDGGLVAPLLGEFQQSDGGITSFRVYPASYVIASCDYALMVQFIPLAVDRTRVRLSWLVRNDARPGIDFDVDKLTELWRVTTEQDNAVVERNQAGVSSVFYEPGAYSEVEDYCERFLNWYLKQLRAGTSTL